MIKNSLLFLKAREPFLLVSVRNKVSVRNFNFLRAKTQKIRRKIRAFITGAL